MPNTIIPTSDWTISDEEAKILIPDSGFIRDYLQYAEGVTDASMIFHYGVIVTLLSCAVAKADIIARGPKRDDGKPFDYCIPSHIWSALLGDSGRSRKSSAMGLGMRILLRAVSITDRADIVLPSDGSLEAWHDFMVENNEVVLYRDELSVLFDQSRRGYSDGLKNWMMEIHGGMPKRRVTRKDNSAGKTQIIEHPRLTVIGGIPPEVFRKVAGPGDWNSGFLARFAFWPGARERFIRYPGGLPETEATLSKWVHKYATSVKGFMYIPLHCRSILMDWFEENIEFSSDPVPDGLYSHFVRYQDLGLRLAVMEAVARRKSPKQLVEVSEEDMYRVVSILSILKKATETLYMNAEKSDDLRSDGKIMDYLIKKAEPVRIKEVADYLGKGYVTTYRHLENLVTTDLIKKKKSYSKSVGRAPWVYFI